MSGAVLTQNCIVLAIEGSSGECFCFSTSNNFEEIVYKWVVASPTLSIAAILQRIGLAQQSVSKTSAKNNSTFNDVIVGSTAGGIWVSIVNPSSLVFGDLTGAKAKLLCLILEELLRCFLLGLCLIY